MFFSACKQSRILDPDKLLNDPVLLSRLKSGCFINDSTETKWIFIRIKNGKIEEIITITLIFILNLIVVNYFKGNFDFIVLKYSTTPSHTESQSAVIHYSNYTPSRITNDIKGLAYLS